MAVMAVMAVVGGLAVAVMVALAVMGGLAVAVMSRARRVDLRGVPLLGRVPVLRAVSRLRAIVMPGAVAVAGCRPVCASWVPRRRAAGLLMDGRAGNRAMSRPGGGVAVTPVRTSGGAGRRRRGHGRTGSR